jgi:hypothetical protein
MALYSLWQAFPLRMRPMALVAGFSLPQLAVPIARLVWLDTVAFNHWVGVHVIELALALASWALINLVPLQPTDRTKAFQVNAHITRRKGAINQATRRIWSSWTESVRCCARGSIRSICGFVVSPRSSR